MRKKIGHLWSYGSICPSMYPETHTGQLSAASRSQPFVPLRYKGSFRLRAGSGPCLSLCLPILGQVSAPAQRAHPGLGNALRLLEDNAELSQSHLLLQLCDLPKHKLHSAAQSLLDTADVGDEVPCCSDAGPRAHMVRCSHDCWSNGDGYDSRSGHILGHCHT